MLYFFIVPLYALFFIAMLVVAFSMRANPQLKPLSTYLFAAAIGTLIGFAVANGLVLLAGVGPMWLAENVGLPEWMQKIAAAFAIVILFFGPILGSFIGVLVGLAMGVGFVNWRKKSTLPTSPFSRNQETDRGDSNDDVIEAEFK